jgi:hypothetical protein
MTELIFQGFFFFFAISGTWIASLGALGRGRTGQDGLVHGRAGASMHGVHACVYTVRGGKQGPPGELDRNRAVTPEISEIPSPLLPSYHNFGMRRHRIFYEMEKDMRAALGY